MTIDSSSTSLSREDVSLKLIGMLADSFNVEASEIDTFEPLIDYGLDSMDAVIVAADMEEWLGFELPATLLWDCKNIDEVVSYVTNCLSSPLGEEEVRSMA